MTYTNIRYAVISRISGISGVDSIHLYRMPEGRRRDRYPVSQALETSDEAGPSTSGPILICPISWYRMTETTGTGHTEDGGPAVFDREVRI
jgi:hypothetical protein